MFTALGFLGIAQVQAGFICRIYYLAIFLSDYKRKSRLVVMESLIWIERGAV